MRNSNPLFKASALLVALALMALGFMHVHAQQSGTITVTVTVEQIGISISPTSHDFGVMRVNENKSSWDGENRAFRLTNTGNVHENFMASGADASGDGFTWTLSSSPGPDNYRVDISYLSDNQLEAPASWLVLTTSDQDVPGDDNVAAGDNRYVDLRLWTPTSTAATAQMSITVTLKVYSVE